MMMTIVFAVALIIIIAVLVILIAIGTEMRIIIMLILIHPIRPYHRRSPLWLKRPRIRGSTLLVLPGTVRPAMIAKRSMGCDVRDLPQGKRFRANLCDLMLSNEITFRRGRSLAEDAMAAGAGQVEDVARAGTPKNEKRNILRRLLKGSKWPQLYWAPVRVQEPTTREVDTVLLPIMLPHELVHAICMVNLDRCKTHSRSHCDSKDLEHLRLVEESTGAEGGTFLGLGLWLDGIACKWDRSQSLDVIVVSFPGWPDRWSQVRVPIFALEHAYTLKDTTFDDVLRVVTWSLKQAFIGMWPTTRHDGSAWLATDSRRCKKRGELATRATLCRVVGDWKMWKDIFRFPAHNENRGICFLCQATPATYNQTGEAAVWRTQRLDHWGVIARLRDQGRTCCPLLSLPFFRVPEICRLDWMHAMDLGVAADFLGQVLAYILHREPGRNRELRMRSLRMKLDGAYVRSQAAVRIDALTESMLNLPRHPKLKTHAAETRALVPVVQDVVKQVVTGDDAISQTIREAMRLLVSLYDALSERNAEARASMADNSRRFCTLFVALAQRLDEFHIRPKLHLCQELLECAPGSSPVLNWTYRDEDFGGSCVQLFRPRGGMRSANRAGLQVLLKFCARHAVPRL